MKSVLEVVRRWPSQKAKAWVESFVADICFHPSVLAVVAFGAAVRTDRFTADIDLLVIYEHPKPRIEGQPIEVDIRWYERNKAESFIREGQELLGWVVRYGELICQKDGYWTKIREDWLNRMPFPSATVADERAERAWRLYRELIGMGDEDAAQEQRLVALTQEARAQLIRHRVYPASRPELPRQLRAIKKDEIAEKLEASLLDREQAATSGGALGCGVIGCTLGDEKVQPQFIRIFRPKEQKETLFNVNHISKIEVEYAVPGADGNYFSTSLERGIASIEAVRFFRVHIAGEVLLLQANPDDPVMKVFDEIYKNAIKG